MIDQTASGQARTSSARLGTGVAAAHSGVRGTVVENTFCVVLIGEIDLSLQPEFHRVADAAVQADLPVEVDARAVTFIDSTGVAFLVQLAKRCDTVVLHPSPVVRWLVELTGVSALVQMTSEPDLAADAERRCVPHPLDGDAH